MSSEAIDQFYGKLSQDQSLQEKYTAAMEAAIQNAIVALASENGCEFTTDELQAALEAQSAELSDQELDAVAGGVRRGSQPAICRVGIATGTVVCFGAAAMPAPRPTP